MAVKDRRETVRCLDQLSSGGRFGVPPFYGLPRWNNYLDTLAYGNGDSVQYTYDEKGWVTKRKAEDGSLFCAKGVSIRQLSRLSGISKGIVEKYLKA